MCNVEKAGVNKISYFECTSEQMPEWHKLDWFFEFLLDYMPRPHDLLTSETITRFYNFEFWNVQIAPLNTTT